MYKRRSAQIACEKLKLMLGYKTIAANGVPDPEQFLLFNMNLVIFSVWARADKGDFVPSAVA